MRGGTTQPILSEDLWARAASGLNSVCQKTPLKFSDAEISAIMMYGEPFAKPSEVNDFIPLNG